MIIKIARLIISILICDLCKYDYDYTQKHSYEVVTQVLNYLQSSSHV